MYLDTDSIRLKYQQLDSKKNRVEGGDLSNVSFIDWFFFIRLRC